jgi:hypothetical protein
MYWPSDSSKTIYLDIKQNIYDSPIDTQKQYVNDNTMNNHYNFYFYTALKNIDKC